MAVQQTMDPKLWSRLSTEMVEQILLSCIPTGIRFSHPNLRPGQYHFTVDPDRRRRPKSACYFKDEPSTRLAHWHPKPNHVISVSKRVAAKALRILWDENIFTFFLMSVDSLEFVDPALDWLKETIHTVNCQYEVLSVPRLSLIRHMAFDTDEFFLPISEFHDHALDTVVVVFPGNDRGGCLLENVHLRLASYWCSPKEGTDLHGTVPPDMVWKRGSEDFGGASWTLTFPESYQKWAKAISPLKPGINWRWEVKIGDIAVKCKRIILKGDHTKKTSFELEEKLNRHVDDGMMCSQHELFGGPRLNMVFEGEVEWMDKKQKEEYEKLRRVGEEDHRDLPGDKIIPIESFIHG